MWVLSHTSHVPQPARLCSCNSQQEYWSGWHFLLQRIFLTQGSNLHLLHWQADSLPLSQLKKKDSFLSRQGLWQWKAMDSLFAIIVVQSPSHIWLCHPMVLQHSRLPCPLLTPGVCSNSCPLSQWCHQTISSFVVPFSSCPQSFTMGWLFTSGGQRICYRPPKFLSPL